VQQQVVSTHTIHTKRGLAVDKIVVHIVFIFRLAVYEIIVNVNVNVIVNVNVNVNIIVNVNVNIIVNVVFVFSSIVSSRQLRARTLFSGLKRE
jgi:hypothetical protein